MLKRKALVGRAVRPLTQPRRKRSPTSQLSIHHPRSPRWCANHSQFPRRGRFPSSRPPSASRCSCMSSPMIKANHQISSRTTTHISRIPRSHYQKTSVPTLMIFRLQTRIHHCPRPNPLPLRPLRPIPRPSQLQQTRPARLPSECLWGRCCQRPQLY